MYGIMDSGSVIARFVAPMTVRSNHPVYASDSLSLKRSTSRRTAQRWEIESAIEPLSMGANALFSQIVSSGHSTTFSVLVPQNYGVILTRTSTGSVTATASLGASSVTVAGNTGLIPKGTFIKFANHNKIYMTTADRSGNGAMTIYPPLRAATSTTSFTRNDDVIMTCLYDLDTIIGMSYSDGILMNMGVIRIVEDV